MINVIDDVVSQDYSYEDFIHNDFEVDIEMICKFKRGEI